MAWTQDDTRDIAAQVIGEIGGDSTREPDGVTEISAAGAIADAEQYPDLPAGNTFRGTVAELAGDLNMAAMLENDQEFAPDVFDIDDVIARIARRGRTIPNPVTE